MNDITRRSLLAGSALAAVSILPGPAGANAPPAGKQSAGVYRYKVGDYELTALYDGVWNLPIDEKFVRNAAFAEVQKALTAAFLPPGTLPIPFTTLMVNTGSKLVLIDTGTGGQITSSAGSMGANMQDAGIDPRQIDVILISHFHPDHINGIKTKDDAVVFPNAEINVPAPEWAYWMDDSRIGTAPDPIKGYFLNVRRVFGSIAKDVRQYEPGKEVAPGITAIPAHGHTPGHCAFTIASGRHSMLLLSDITNHPWLFARHPEWQAAFDMDGAMAAATREKMLDLAAAERMLVQGYHFPFPASGYIAKVAGGYDFVPVMWQSAL
jgi:glyoxylase-like metal-dependent hydrolase (beta-lactamase superfamily II)